MMMVTMMMSWRKTRNKRKYTKIRSRNRRIRIKRWRQRKRKRKSGMEWKRKRKMSKRKSQENKELKYSRQDLSFLFSFQQRHGRKSKEKESHSLAKEMMISHKEVNRSCYIITFRDHKGSYQTQAGIMCLKVIAELVIVTRASLLFWLYYQNCREQVYWKN